MYSLRIEASERRMAQVPLQPGAGMQLQGSGTPGPAAATGAAAVPAADAAARGAFTPLGDEFGDDDFDDERALLLGPHVDDGSPAIEFTAGNPRVEHITGVVHLYRPMPGRAAHAQPPAPPSGAGGQPPGTPPPASAGAAAPPAPAAGQEPLKPSAWNNGPPPGILPAGGRPVPAAPAATQAQAQSEAAIALLPPERCEQLCCLALPPDLIIADFCAFLGGHLQRLRQMRVLRRVVAPPPPHHHHSPGPAGHAQAHATAAAAVAAPQPAQAAERQQQQQQQPSLAPSASSSSLAAAAAGRAQHAAAAAADTGAAPPAPASGKASASGSVAGGEPSQGQTQARRRISSSPSLAGEAALVLAAPPLAAAPAAAAPEPSCVCMVVLTMESREAADELYLDLNGKPFSSLEPDIVCRLVYVRQVEVTSPGGRKPDAGTAGVAGPDAAAGAGAGGACGCPTGSPSSPPPSAPVPAGLSELPTCPVCLERLDEHVSGIVTTVCNHMFHSECLQKWADTSCPVCRYCTQGSSGSSRCGVCATASDLWICLICGHIGCGRYRAGHAADHWRSSGHCYALELETQRVWDYVGDNYVHRLIQSKTDGKLVEMAAPAVGHHQHQHHHRGTHPGMGPGAGGAGGAGAVPPGGAPEGPAGGAGKAGSGALPLPLGPGSPGTVGAATGPAAGAARGAYSPYNPYNPYSALAPGGSYDLEDEQVKEALLASKLDAIAAEYNHLLASQLDSQRQYFEGLLTQATIDADRRCMQVTSEVEAARAAAAEAQAALREEARKRHAADKKLSEVSEALRSLRKEAEFLRSLNETLIANTRDYKAQLAAAADKQRQADAAMKDMQEQVRDLMVYIEAQRTIEDAAAQQGGSELKDATVLPLQPPPQPPGRHHHRAAGSGTAGSVRGGGGGGKGDGPLARKGG